MHHRIQFLVQAENTVVAQNKEHLKNVCAASATVQWYLKYFVSFFFFSFGKGDENLILLFLQR